MKTVPIGIAILTNGQRLEALKTCVRSFLSSCYYRPLVIATWDNGSTDGTADWLASFKPPYGVDWRMGRSETDLGCAAGTNKCIEMVKDCELTLHLESDFEHLSANLSGEDVMWLHRAVAFMQTGECDYLYLRRMVNERDIYQHWWSQWMKRITVTNGRYLKCDGFWWSNNPTLFRTKALFDGGTLPLDASKDGPKGTPGWSQPELATPRPPNAWIHKWGLFVHELSKQYNLGNMLGMMQCRGEVGASKCKYGFFVAGNSPFCSYCDLGLGYEDMEAHAARFLNR